jgi:hypothetical protein
MAQGRVGCRCVRQEGQSHGRGAIDYLPKAGLSSLQARYLI